MGIGSGALMLAPMIAPTLASKVPALQPVAKSINTAQRISGAIQGAQQVKNITDMKNQQGNPHDRVLGNPGIVPKKRTWEMPKYAESNDESLDTTKKKKRLTKKQKAGIAIGTTIGALALADILSKGDVFAPVGSAWEGARAAPGAMFNRAKSGGYGPAASVGANAVDKAIRQTKDKSHTDYGWKSNQKSKSSNWGNNGGSNNQGNKGGVFGEAGRGAAYAAGTLGVYMLAQKLLKDKKLKDNYNSKVFSKKEIDKYQKTVNHDPVTTIPINMYNSVRNTVADIKAENQKSDKNE